ncbi:acyl-CoA dehydrogenase family protein [Nocardia mexicana]|uniref:Alkylation response protein AidB-like acyl-CoA dehydrogenase n=1 Tax=Nocardia mexicana TaxID=279262 RepID=A0A370H8R9_9NOCA|nr:acyl-CoA dehydrogenase family protein [Nocardia mexicana]RDI53068.1 alkylation response protein AidB-like acyl-CoA dehydrogenase [Nocardia mexicana]
MKLELSSAELAFRDELRAVFYDEIPADIRARSADGQLTRDDIVASQQILNKHGLAVPNWPVARGGRDWTPLQRHLYVSEMQRAAVPTPLPFNVSMVGPIIAEFGSEQQKDRFLPATANLDIWWSQGFSEPEAGSDLASLKTTAIRDGDSYLVNGQKTWTTLGQYGDWMFLLARTDTRAERPQHGISFLLVDMTTPGIERRPIRLIDGGAEVNEFFFDNVRVPAENLVGEENRGWSYAKFLLGNERNAIAGVGNSQRSFEKLVARADKLDVGGGPLSSDPGFRTRLHAAKLRLLALEATQLRVTGSSEGGRANPVSSLLKLEGSRVQQELSALRVEAAGSDALLVGGHDGAGTELHAELSDAVAGAHYLNLRKLSIFGGTNEIQRGVIAKTILGL